MAYPIEINWYETAVLFEAVLIGLLIGVEREYHHKPAGVRTLLLTTVGSCIFTMLSTKMGITNPDRIAANIVTGVGFLGAGAIFQAKNKVNGLTTATTIWVCAALGMAAGSGHQRLAIGGTAITIFVLSFLVFLERFIAKINQVRHIRIGFHKEAFSTERIEQLFSKHRIQYFQENLIMREEVIEIYWRITGTKKNQKALATEMLSQRQLLRVEF